MAFLRQQLARKALEFEAIVTFGRTQLQDPVPMTLGQEFTTYAAMVDEDERNIRGALVLVHEIDLGGTAIGTGTDTRHEYALAVRGHLQQITGLPLETEGSLLYATQECSALVLFSGVLKRTAVKLSKICSNLKLLSSGPRAGLAEINPAIPEAVKQVASEVFGNAPTPRRALVSSRQIPAAAFRRPRPFDDPNLERTKVASTYGSHCCLVVF
jgi:aspartate ammonia-lyase